MKKWLPILLLVFFFSNCKSKTEKEEQVVNTEETPQKVYEVDSTLITTQAVNDWVQQTLKVTDVPSKLKLEEFWKDDSLMISPFNPGPGFYKDYGPVLRWSSDSNYIIDIGSYGHVVTKDRAGNTKLEAGEPDSELALIEPGKQQRTRLMFVGPSSEILDAKWIDSSQAMIIGTFDKTGNDNHDTLVWLIDVRDNFFRLYNIKSHR